VETPVKRQDALAWPSESVIDADTFATFNWESGWIATHHPSTTHHPPPVEVVYWLTSAAHPGCVCGNEQMTND